MISGEMKARFAALEIKISDAKAQLARLQNERLDMIAEAFGVRAGSKVSVKGKVFVVVRLDWAYRGLDSKPWLKARPLKKDGTPSEMVRTLYGDWELAE